MNLKHDAEVVGIVGVNVYLCVCLCVCRICIFIYAHTFSTPVICLYSVDLKKKKDPKIFILKLQMVERFNLFFLMQHKVPFSPDISMCKLS